MKYYQQYLKYQSVHRDLCWSCDVVQVCVGWLLCFEVNGSRTTGCVLVWPDLLADSLISLLPYQIGCDEPSLKLNYTIVYRLFWGMKTKGTTRLRNASGHSVSRGILKRIVCLHSVPISWCIEVDVPCLAYYLTRQYPGVPQSWFAQSVLYKL